MKYDSVTLYKELHFVSRLVFDTKSLSFSYSLAIKCENRVQQKTKDSNFVRVNAYKRVKQDGPRDLLSHFPLYVFLSGMVNNKQIFFLRT